MIEQAKSLILSAVARTTPSARHAEGDVLVPVRPFDPFLLHFQKMPVPSSKFHIEQHSSIARWENGNAGAGDKQDTCESGVSAAAIV